VNEEIKHRLPQLPLFQMKQAAHPGSKRIPKGQCHHGEENGKHNADQQGPQEKIAKENNVFTAHGCVGLWWKSQLSKLPNEFTSIPGAVKLNPPVDRLRNFTSSPYLYRS